MSNRELEALVRRRYLVTRLLPCALAFMTLFAPVMRAAATPQITSPVDDSQRVVLAGHVYPLAQARFDVGVVPKTLSMVELRWVIKRSASQVSEMNALMAAQQTRDSTSFQQWLTPAQFGARFGADERDIAAATTWLQSHGFKVGAIPAGRGYVPFSGTAERVATTFHTSIHYFLVAGEKHFANTVDPQIPSAFQPLISGMVGLHDFYPSPGVRARVVQRPMSRVTPVQPEVNDGGNQNFVGPTDAAIIYNLASVYQAKLTGSGMKVAVAAQSDIDSTIPTQYWTAFGVNKGQQLSSIAASTATDPGRTGGGAESEAYLDTEIIGGLVPNVQIILVRDRSSITALMYAIDQNLAPVLSVSFGACEQKLGVSENSEIANAYQQAVMQGMTVLVSTGDAGIAECDDVTGSRDTVGVTVVSGLAVNGLASTPYDTAVGGTDFNGVLVQQGHYWGSNASGTLANALSYIPEMVWNLSCANPVTAQLDTGSSNVLALCNNSHYSSLDLIDGAGGGLSSCVSLNANSQCTGGYVAPFWQTEFGFSTRALPDVAMLANGWVFCTETQTCAATGTILVGSGTSAAAPAMAALVLLRDQYKISVNNPDGRQGNINPALYLLGQYQQSVLSANPSYDCDADVGASFSAFCIFHDVQTGSVDQPCKATTFAPASSLPSSACATGSSTYGIVTTAISGGSEDAFLAAAGYDLASGLGSVNAANFVFDNLSFLETNALGTGVHYLGTDYANFTVWRPSSGTWYTMDGGTGAFSSHQFGLSTDIPLVGDFDGDRVSDIAVWRPSTGVWYITQSSNGQVVTQQWGISSDIPVLGDFDGDGRTDVAVWRPSTGYWYIIQSVDNQEVSQQFGLSTDIPVVGDFDGDGKSDIAVFRPSTGYWYILQSSTNQVVSQQWGASTDIPVVGDFDGDGKSDLAVFRPSTGTWYIIESSNGQILTRQWGENGDQPASRDYDGDGIADIAVWRPSTGYWYVIESSSGQVLSQQWGVSSDIPVITSQTEH